MRLNIINRKEVLDKAFIGKEKIKSKLKSGLLSGIGKVKANYGYFKKGVQEDAKKYQKLQSIKGTPPAYRSTLDQNWADQMNKTKRTKKNIYQ